MTGVSTTLPAATSSVPTARRFVRTTLEGLGLFAAYDAAELILSEVVTNAVLHARTEFTVEVRRDGDLVRVSVRDLSPTMPRQRRYGVDSTTGRGLRLVATLAVAWGVDRTSAGKTVGFDVLAAGDAGVVEEPWEADADLDALLASFENRGCGTESASRPLTARRQKAVALRSAA